MDKFEKALLSQFHGQKVTKECPVCNQKTELVFHKEGTMTCSKCKNKVKVDLTEVVKGLKKLGLTVF